MSAKNDNIEFEEIISDSEEENKENEICLDICARHYIDVKSPKIPLVHKIPLIPPEKKLVDLKNDCEKNFDACPFETTDAKDPVKYPVINTNNEDCINFSLINGSFAENSALIEENTIDNIINNLKNDYLVAGDKEGCFEMSSLPISKIEDKHESKFYYSEFLKGSQNKDYGQTALENNDIKTNVIENFSGKQRGNSCITESFCDLNLIIDNVNMQTSPNVTYKNAIFGKDITQTQTPDKLDDNFLLKCSNMSLNNHKHCTNEMYDYSQPLFANSQTPDLDIMSDSIHRWTDQNNPKFEISAVNERNHNCNGVTGDSSPSLFSPGPTQNDESDETHSLLIGGVKVSNVCDNEVEETQLHQKVCCSPIGHNVERDYECNCPLKLDNIIHGAPNDSLQYGSTLLPYDIEEAFSHDITTNVSHSAENCLNFKIAESCANLADLSSNLKLDNYEKIDGVVTFFHGECKEMSNNTTMQSPSLLDAQVSSENKVIIRENHANNSLEKEDNKFDYVLNLKPEQILPGKNLFCVNSLDNTFPNVSKQTDRLMSSLDEGKNEDPLDVRREKVKRNLFFKSGATRCESRFQTPWIFENMEKSKGLNVPGMKEIRKGENLKDSIGKNDVETTDETSLTTHSISREKFNDHCVQTISTEKENSVNSNKNQQHSPNNKKFAVETPNKLEYEINIECSNDYTVKNHEDLKLVLKRKKEMPPEGFSEYHATQGGNNVIHPENGTNISVDALPRRKRRCSVYVDETFRKGSRKVNPIYQKDSNKINNHSSETGLKDDWNSKDDIKSSGNYMKLRDRNLPKTGSQRNQQKFRKEIIHRKSQPLLKEADITDKNNCLLDKIQNKLSKIKKLVKTKNASERKLALASTYLKHMRIVLQKSELYTSMSVDDGISGAFSDSTFPLKLLNLRNLCEILIGKLNDIQKSKKKNREGINIEDSNIRLETFKAFSESKQFKTLNTSADKTLNVNFSKSKNSNKQCHMQNADLIRKGNSNNNETKEIDKSLGKSDNNTVLDKCLDHKLKVNLNIEQNSKCVDVKNNSSRASKHIRNSDSLMESMESLSNNGVTRMQTTVHGEGNIYHSSKKCRLNEVSDNDNVNSASDTENNMAKDMVTSSEDATQDIDGLEALLYKDCKNQNHYPLTIQENGYCKINNNITNDSFPSLMSVQMNLEVIPKSAENFPKFSESLIIQHTQNFSEECGKNEVTSLKLKTKSSSPIKIPDNEEFVCKTVDTNKSLCEKRINSSLENVSSCTTDVSDNIIKQYSSMHEYSCSVSTDDTQSESLLKETGIQNSCKTKTPVVSTMPRPVYPFNTNINEIPIGFQRIEVPKSLAIVRLEPKHPDSATLPPQSNHPTLKQVPVNMKTAYNEINSPQINNSIYYPVPQPITITKTVSNNETSVPYIAPSVLALKNSVQKTFTQVPVVMKNIWNGNQFSQSTNHAKPHSVFQPTTHTKSVPINSVATTSSPAPSMSVIKSVSSINIKEPRKFVDLQQLIRSGILKPDTNVLSLHTPERIVFASLDENGRIISNGKLYDTPMQWCNEFPNFFKQGGKKKRDFCYRRIYYQGRTLHSYANSWNQGPSGRATVSQAAEGSSILGDSGSDPEVTQRSIAPLGDPSIHLEPPDCGPGVLNLSKMKLLMIGDNEVGPISIDKWPDLHWEDIDKW